MFQKYFLGENERMTKIRGKLSERSKIEEFQEPLQQFFRDHLPNHFKVNAGRAVDSLGHRSQEASVLISQKWIENLGRIMGDAEVIEFVAGAIYAVPVLTIDTLNDMLQKVISFKRLTPKSQAEGEGVARKIPCAIFAYDAEVSFHQVKDYLLHFYKSHDILNAYEIDMVAILNHSVTIKDWEDPNVKYRSIETREDSLMWFYILYLEYILEDNPMNMGFSFRDYFRETREYKDY